MPDSFYQHKLYPFQDMVLKSIQEAHIDFYLTGGTALSRFYLNHRYSDDLDLFVNGAQDFKDQVRRIVDFFKKNHIQFDIGTATETFVRILTEKEDISLKVDFVNDVAYHYGDFKSDPIYCKIDNWRNILSNKICALSRLEAKDVADILFIAKQYQYSWEEIIKEAGEKDLWVEPLDVSKLIGGFPTSAFQNIKWVQPVELDKFDDELKQIQSDIFYGNDNSLSK